MSWGKYSTKKGWVQPGVHSGAQSAYSLIHWSWSSMHWSTRPCIKTTIARDTGHRGPYMSCFQASKHLKRRVHQYKNECFWLGKTLSKYMCYYSIEKRIHKEVEYVDKSTHIGLHTKQNQKKKSLTDSNPTQLFHSHEFKPLHQTISHGLQVVLNYMFNLPEYRKHQHLF